MNKTHSSVFNQVKATGSLTGSAKPIRRRFGVMVPAALGVASLMSTASTFGQAAYSWQGGSTGTPAWLTAGNWNPSANFPGVSVGSGGNIGDVAIFNNSGGTSTAYGTVGISLNASGAGLSLGAISVAGSSNLILGNSGTVASLGTLNLTLNGASASIGSLAAGTILQTSTNNLTFNSNVGTGTSNTSPLGVSIPNAGSIVNVGGTSTVAFSGLVNVSGAGSIVKQGTGTLAFNAGSTVSLTGGFTINSGAVVFASNSSTFTGGVTLNSGGLLGISTSTSAVWSGNSLTSSPVGVGALNINGGTIFPSGAVNPDVEIPGVNVNGNFTVGGKVGGAGYVQLGGTVTFSGADTITLSRYNNVSSIANGGYAVKIAKNNGPNPLLTTSNNGSVEFAADPTITPTGTNTWVGVGSVNNVATSPNLPITIDPNVMFVSVGNTWGNTAATEPALTVNGALVMTKGSNVANGSPNFAALSGSGVVIGLSNAVDGVYLTGGLTSTFSGQIDDGAYAPSVLGYPTTPTSVVSVFKTGAGLQVFAGTNNYSGTTSLTGGTLRAIEGVGLPTASYLNLGGGVLEFGGTATFTRSLGSGTATGQVNIGTGNDGFSAFGGPAIVSIGGTASPTQLNWGSSNFTPTTLTLNASTATAPLTFENSINFGGTGRTINVNANTVYFTGNITSNAVNVGSLQKAGNGTLVMLGNLGAGGTDYLPAGVLQIGNGGTTGSITTGAISNSSVAGTQATGTLIFNRSDNYATAVSIAGYLNWAQQGPGTLIYTGSSVTAGTATFTAAVQVGDGVSTNGLIGSSPASLIVNDASITYNNPGFTYTVGTITGTGSVTQNSAPGSVVDLAGPNTYSGPTTVTSGTLNIGSGMTTGSITTATVTTGVNGVLGSNRSDNVSFSTNITGAGGFAMNGTGTTTLTGVMSYAGNTTVNSGQLDLVQPLRPVTGSLVVTGPGAAVVIDPTAYASPAGYAVSGQFASITVGPSMATNVPTFTNVSTATYVATNRPTDLQSVLIAGGLSIGTNGTTGSGAPVYTGFVDLGNNDMLISGGASSLATIDAYVGAWLGSAGTGTNVGLGSTLASPTSGAYTTIAVIANSDGRGGALYSTFDGVSVTANDVLVKYTYVGDTTLKGYVNGTDLANLLAGMSGGLTGWVNGDLNYDGVVNSTDLNLLLAALANQGASFDDGSGPGASGAVPEPGSLGLGALVLPLLGRRRKR